MKFLPSLLLLLSVSASTVDANDNQRLVLFAGPHGAASSSVEAFFRHFASPAEQVQHGSFQGWEWPSISDLPLVSQEQISPSTALSLLVTKDKEEDMQEEIMKHIYELWTREDRPNLFLGTEELDRLGLTPYSGFDAMRAATRIANRLELSHESVEIVMNYRTPRLDQWVSIWKHLTKDSHEHYRPFLCTSREIGVRKVWESLDTAMNPLKVAQAYREKNFRVTLMDMAKVKENERDVVHAIGCDVLGLPCGGQHPDWIDGLFNHTFTENHEEREYPNFNPTQIQKMEAAFRARDCYYANSLMGDSQIRVANGEKDTLFAECHSEMASEYARLADTTALYNELRHVRDCVEDDITLAMVSTLDAETAGADEVVNVTNPTDAVTVEEKEDVISELEEKKEAIQKETELINEEETEINEQIAEEEDSMGAGDVESKTEDEEVETEKAIEDVEEDIKANPDSEAAQALGKGDDSNTSEYKSPDAKGSALGVLIPVVLIGAVVAFFVSRRRKSARQPLPVEFASVDEEFGDATMEDMQPRYVD